MTYWYFMCLILLLDKGSGNYSRGPCFLRLLMLSGNGCLYPTSTNRLPRGPGSCLRVSLCFLFECSRSFRETSILVDIGPGSNDS